MAQRAGRVGTKSEVVQIRLSGADKDELLRAADGVGLSLSAWIRMVLLTEARAGMHSGKRSSPK
jgi:antitoxin component of RelBE/YafQ-DinJ toxin-antitoxin module